MEIRFHLDESLDPVIAEALRRYGMEATSARDAELLGAADEEQLEFAAAHGRVLISHDADFARLHSTRPGHAGIVLIRQRRYSIGELARIIALVHSCFSAEEMHDHIEFF